MVLWGFKNYDVLRILNPYFCGLFGKCYKSSYFLRAYGMKWNFMNVFEFVSTIFESYLNKFVCKLQLPQTAFGFISTKISTIFSESPWEIRQFSGLKKNHFLATQFRKTSSRTINRLLKFSNQHVKTYVPAIFPDL